MADLSEHPFQVFMDGEAFVSDGERAWLAWVKQAKRALGHDLDGNQARDGYSLDYAHDAFCAGVTVADYVKEVRANR